MQITVPDSKMSIGDVRYIKFPTWLKTIQDKMFFCPLLPKGDLYTRKQHQI